MTLVDLYIRAEEKGIEVDDVPMREVVAASFPEGWIAIDTAKIETYSEEKVILAHEIGHCETGSFYNVYSSFDERGKHECRANKRSYEILVPRDELKKAINDGITEIWELAGFFEVPYEFMYKAAEYWKQKDLAG